jgi:hypothetical protein
MYLYGKYSGTEINVDGKEYLMMRQSDILAVIIINNLKLIIKIKLENYGKRDKIQH